MTPAEVAALTRVTTKTLQRWRFEGHGPQAVRLGYRTVRYRRADVEQFVNGYRR